MRATVLALAFCKYTVPLVPPPTPPLALISSHFRNTSPPHHILAPLVFASLALLTLVALAYAQEPSAAEGATTDGAPADGGVEGADGAPTATDTWGAPGTSPSTPADPTAAGESTTE